MYIQLINQALPLEVQQEAEKERLIREKGKKNRIQHLMSFFCHVKS